MMILCPACSAPGRPIVITVEPEDKLAYCDQCQRRYWLETLTLKQSEEKRRDNAWADYQLTGYNWVGRKINYQFAAQTRLPLKQESQITIVKRGPSLVGLANQDNNTWTTIQPTPQTKNPWRGLIAFVSWVTAVLGLMLLILLLSQLAEAMRQYGSLTIIIAALLLIIVALSPALFWLVKANRIGEKKSLI